MDTPRNVTLVYNSERAAPRPLVQVDVEKPSGFPTLQYMKFRVKEIGGSYQTFVNGASSLYFDPAGTWTRIGGRLNTSWATGMYDIQIEVTFYHSSGSQVQTWDTKLMVVNESNAPIAEGWTVAGVQRLYVQSDSSVLIVEGGGPAAWFWKDGASWVSPNGDMSTLSKSGSGFKRVYLDQTDVRFNSDGEMTDVYDPDDNRTQFGYQSSPTYDLFYIQDPMGKRTYMTFDSIWMRYHIYADLSPYRYTILEFTSGRLTKIKDPDGDSTVINYTAQTPSSVYFPTSVTDRNGSTRSYQFYATSLELWKVTAPAVDIFDEGSPLSPITEFAPWPREVSPVSTTSSGSPFDAPASDEVWGSVTAPGGAVTSTRVNGFGSPLEIDAPAGTFDTDITYNQHGSPVKVVRSDGWGTDSIKYDTSDRPIWVRLGSTAATPRQFKYGSFSRVDSAWGGGEQTQDYFINATTGRIDSVKTGSTAMTRYTYNTNGQLRRVKNAEDDYTSRIGYDALGNTVADTSAEFVITTYGRDSYGRATSVATSGLATRAIAYDVMNRPTDVDDGVNGQDTQYDYFPTFVRVTDPKGQVYEEYVNALGWTTTSEDPLGDDHAYQYDLDGLVRRWTNRRGQNVDFTYDTLGRLKTVAADTLSYASAGKTVTATNAYVTDATYLNHRGQPDLVQTYFEELDKTYTLEYTYDSLTGVLTKLEPSGDAGTFMTRTYSFNAAKGTFNWIKLDGEETDFSYALDLALSQYGFPGGKDVEVGRTEGNQLAWTNADAGYGVYTDRSVEYDKGRIQLQAVPGLPAGHRYGYDGLGRLLRDTTIEYTGSCGFDEETGYDCGSWSYDGHVTYDYDAANNREDLSADYVTGSNRLSSFDGCSYSTDDDGNITVQNCPGTSNDYTFHWDARNRLDSLNAYAFRYDPAGRLARIDFEGDPYRYFWWDGDNLLAELDTDGTVIAEYSYYPGSLDRLHAVRKGGSSTKYYAHRDAAGNVVGLTYGSNPAETYVYDAWGQPAVGGGTWVSVPNRAQWKGALHFEEFDLYYMRARWYQPRTGRFLSEDLIGLEGGINPYVFAADDPINRRDPTGLLDCTTQWLDVEVWDPESWSLDIISIRVRVCKGSAAAGGWPDGGWPGGDSGDFDGFGGKAGGAGKQGRVLPPWYTKKGSPFEFDYSHDDHLHTWSLEHAVFKLAKILGPNQDGSVDAYWRLIDWKNRPAVNNQGDIFLWYNSRLRIRSRIQELSPGNWSQDRFEQVGPARGGKFICFISFRC
jgi:RHS repeat-associated protein